MAIERWNDAYLESMRSVGDPPADEVITAVIQAHGVNQLNQTMKNLVQNDELIPADLPICVQNYLNEEAILPSWVDFERIKRGEQFFLKHWSNAITILFCASLPNAYSARKGAEVLYLTQRLTGHVHRRIFETAQFVLDVMAEGGIGQNGRGVRTAQKVRLIHAATRYYILNRPEWRNKWDNRWGVPINQEDLAGTLMTFSIQILLGLEKFGIEMSAEEKEDYLYAWRAIGFVLGVDPELIPQDVAEATWLAETIFQRQEAPSEAGQALTAALLEFMQNQLPFHFANGLPATIMRHCIEPETADALNVPQSDWTTLLLNAEEAFLSIVGHTLSHHQKIAQLFEAFSQALIQSLIDLERGGSRTNFTIPSGLRERI
ncbi:MAG: oxygenase MpaB family protein [Chloroflexota bacterium]